MLFLLHFMKKKENSVQHYSDSTHPCVNILPSVCFFEGEV